METTFSAGPFAPALTCDSAELERIVAVLRQCTEPEEILLFGSLAGATPFSEITAYDLFVLTANRSAEDWNDIRSYLKFKLPTRSRAIPLINLYLATPAEINAKLSSFYRFVRSEGKALYSRRSFTPKSCNYERYYYDASDRYERFFRRAGGLLEAAAQRAAVSDWRLTAFLTACGAEMLLHALYAAYHAADTDLRQSTALFLRMQSLSPELFILLDPEHGGSSRMLSRLDVFRERALYRSDCAVERSEITEYLARTERLKDLVRKLSQSRLELYKSRIAESA